MSITAGGDFSWTPTESQGGSDYSATITVTDSGTGNLIDSETITITVTEVNVAPVLAEIGNKSVDEQAELTFTATASDQDLPADTLTFSLDPAAIALGMSITAGGDFSWTPTESQGGSDYSATITVTDSGTGNLIDFETITITVTEVNVAPVLAEIGNKSVDEQAELAFTATASDQDLPADTLTFSLDPAAIALGMSITAGGDFSWTPTESQGGSDYSAIALGHHRDRQRTAEPGTSSTPRRLRLPSLKSTRPTWWLYPSEPMDRIGRLPTITVAEVNATDLVVISFGADGQDWTVAYDVTNQAAAAFDIGIYRSSDGLTADTWIQTKRVTNPADLALGTGHTITIDPNFTDVEQDYYLVVKLDNADENSEATETNNQAVLSGGVFLNGSQLHVHGTDGADTLDFADSGMLDVTLDTQSYSYNSEDISALRVRMHDGHDIVTAAASIGVSMWAFGGDGDDTIHGTSFDDRLHGGEGDDTLYGGDDDDDDYGGSGGIDVIHGDGGNDTIYGGTQNDTLYGDAGNDTIYGDSAVSGSLDGADMIHGGAGNDTLFGGGGNDTLYGDAGADTLDGQSGTDILHGGDDLDDPEILDNGEVGYIESGVWNDDASGGGFNGGQRIHAAGNGTEKATWTFSNLPSGDYEVHATWDDPDDYGGATDAPFSVFDGGAFEGTFNLNQRFYPSGSTVADASWQQLGSFTITSGTLNVELAESPNGTVRADAVRIVQVSASANTTPTLDALSNPVAIDEDAPQQTVNLSGITAGGAETQNLTVTATSNNPGLIPDPTVIYTSDNPTGSIQYTPIADQSGTATITVTVTDDGNPSESVFQTFTVTVDPVNDAPTLDPISDPAAIAETAPQQTVNLSGITAGGGETQNLTVAATSDNTGLIPNPTVIYTPNNSTGSLQYTPVAGQIGTATITVTVTDDGSASESFSQTFTVTVNPVNDTPTLDAISNPAAIDEDAPQQTVNLSGITAGGGKTQNLTVTATSDNASLIPHPTVIYTSDNSTGSIQYTPVADQSGTATITVTVTDDGSPSESVFQTFTVTVDPVNDAPTLDPIADPAAIGKDAPQQTISLLGITAGGSETQVLTVTATSDNTGLILHPTVLYTSPSSTGSLQYTPVPGQSGTATITVTVADDGGPGETITESFTVTVVNQPPAASDDTYWTDGLTDLTVDALSGVLANDTDPNSGDTLTAHLVSGPSEGTLILNTDGSFTYTPTTPFTGPDTFVYEARDPENVNSQATVTVWLNAPPIADAGGPYSTVETVAITLNGSGSSDPEAGALTYQWDFDGNGIYGESGTEFGDEIGIAPSFRAVDDLIDHTVTLRVTDAAGLSTTNTARIDVYNLAPAVTVGDNATIVAGATFTRSGVFQDAANDAPWTATVDYGEGAGPEALDFDSADNTFELNHVYVNPGPYTVTVTVTDDDGGQGVGCFVVTADVKPIIDTGQTFSVWESALDGTAVGTVAATDNANALQDWTITDGNSDGVFAIDATTGRLSVANTTNLDFTNTSSYELTLTVSDGVHVSEPATVSINVVDVNDPILVTTYHDSSVPDDGVTTLREAIEQANATTGIDLIQFALGVDTHVVLLSQASSLAVTSDVQINGPGDGTPLTVTLTDLNTPAIRILSLSATHTLKMADLMITGGNLVSGDGAGIWNAGNLILDRVTVANNTTASGDGGGIFNTADGTLTLNNSIVSTNSASGSGGGIYNAGSLTATNVTVTANSAATTGDGLFATGLAQSSLGNSIVAGNADDVDVDGVFTSLGHNLIGNGNGATGFVVTGDQVGTSAAVIDAHLGPLQDNGGAAPTHQLLVASPAIDAGDNDLAAFVDQRGAPRVLDGLDPDDATDDIATVDIGAFEFGAFIANVLYDAVDMTPAGDGRVDVDLTLEGDQTSIRGIVQELNALAGLNNPGGGAMEGHVLPNGPGRIYNLTIQGGNEQEAATGDLDIYGNLVFLNAASDTATFLINGNSHSEMSDETMGIKDRVFHVQPGAVLTLDGTCISGGYAFDDGTPDAGNGGGVLNDGGTLHINDMRRPWFGSFIGFGSNDADKSGGGIYTRDGEVTITSSIVSGNQAFHGAGLYIESGTVTIDEESIVKSNSADTRGGGIYMEDGQLTIAGSSSVRSNSLGEGSLGSGGGVGIFIEDSPTATVLITSQSEVTENSVNVNDWAVNGGGIRNGGRLTIEDGSRITKNVIAPDFCNGAGIYNSGTLEVYDSYIDDNYDDVERFGGSNYAYGGGIYNDGGTVLVSDSSISRNYVGDGAAIYNNNGEVTLIGVEILQNTSPWTGPVTNFDLDARLRVIDSTIAFNSTEQGGAIHNQHGTVTVENSTLASNCATQASQAIQNLGENLMLAEMPELDIFLDASMNSEQTIMFVTDVAPLLPLDLPVTVKVDDERMRIVEIDTVKQAVTVIRGANRTEAAEHSVSAEVGYLIDEEQRQIAVKDASNFADYQLPRDIVVDNEVMTVYEIDYEHNLLTVARGRNGTVSTEHVEAGIWGLGGWLTISGTTISENGESRTISGRDAYGGVLTNVLHPHVRMTIVEDCTFLNNHMEHGQSIVVGREIHNNFGVGEPSWVDLSPSIFLQNTVVAGGADLEFEGNLGTAVVPWNRYDTDRSGDLRLDGIVLSGGNNLIDVDYVGETGLFEDIDPVTTTVQIPVPEATEFPETLPFKIRVAHVENDELIAEEMLVTALSDDEQGLATLTVQRGQDGTVPLAHDRGSRVTFSRTGFWMPGDKHGSDTRDPVSYQTTVSEPAGIQITDTQFHVADPTNFPDVPFTLSVGHLDDLVYTIETMEVTQVAGTLVTVVRGNAVAHPDGANVTFDRYVSFALDPLLGPLADNGGPTETHAPLPDSPVLETGSRQGFTGTTTRSITTLSEAFFFETEVYMAVVDTVELTAFAFADDETLSVADTTNLPEAPFLLRIEDELMDVTAVDDLTNRLSVTRGTHDTIPCEYASGTAAIAGTAVAADDTQVTLNLADVSSLPEAPFVIRVDAELMHVSAVDAATNMVTVDRSSYGSTVQAHATRSMVNSSYGGREFQIVTPIDPAANVTAIPVDSTLGFPPTPFLIRVNGETAKVVTVNDQTNTLTIEQAFESAIEANDVGKPIDRGTFLVIEDASQIPKTPVGALIGTEVVRITSVDLATNLITVERAAYSSPLSSHEVGISLIVGEFDVTQGYCGLDLVLTESVDNAGQTQLVIAGPSTALPPTPFGILVDQEQMTVDTVSTQDDGTSILTVARGVDGTASNHPAGSTVLVLTAQNQAARFVDNDADGIVGVDIGAAEGIVFTVDSTADLPDLIPGNGLIDTTTGDVTLRAAVMEANAQRAGAIIVLTPESYSLNSDLEITGDITVLAENAATTTIIGDQQRVFTVQPDGSLTLVNLTVTGGTTLNDGGGVFVDRGSLFVYASHITGNEAAYGAGIANASGTVTIIDSSISANTSSLSGGGVASFGGQLTIRNSTVSGNQATNAGGGLFADADTELSIVNDTVAFNTAATGGGIYSSALAAIGNSIVAQNSAATDTTDVYGRFTSLGHNLIGVRNDSTASLDSPVDQSVTSLLVDQTTGFPQAPFAIFVDSEEMLVTAVAGNQLTVQRAQSDTTGTSHLAGAELRIDGLWQTGDQTGTASAPIDPLLGPLQLNHGTTPNHALSEGSPALDAGNNALLSGMTTQLGSDIFDSGNNLTVTDWECLPDTPFRILVGDELMNVIEKDHATLTVDLRQNPTTHWRGTTITLLTDQRGVPRPIVGDTSLNSTVDVGAYEATAEFAIAMTDTVKTEGDTGLTSYTFTVSRGGLLDETVTVDYKVARSGALTIDESDFGGTMPLGTLTFLPDELTKTVTIDFTGDTMVEPDETFQVVLSDPSEGMWLTARTVSGQILDNDSASLTITDVTAAEGLALVFDVTLDHDVQGGLYMPWNVSDDTATEADSDYLTNSGTLAFLGQAGETHKILIRTEHDQIVENDETIQILLGDLLQFGPDFVPNVTIDTSALGTIENNDTTTLTVDEVRVFEGDAGNLSVSLTVTQGLYAVDESFAVTVATPAGSQYVPTSQQLTFSGAANESQTFTVDVVGDLVPETLLSIPLTLSALSAGGREAAFTLVDGSLTVVDNDQPTLQVENVVLTEGDAGDTIATFNVVLASPLGPLTVDIATQDDTAVAGTDYTANSDTLTFTGVNNETKTFQVSITGDNVVEAVESFNVVLSNLSAGGNEASYTLLDGAATIKNDDEVSFTIESVTFSEGYVAEGTIPNPTPGEPGTSDIVPEGVEFLVTLHGESDIPISLTLQTVNETTDINDVPNTTETLIFDGTDGQTLTFVVPAANNDNVEPTKTFSVVGTNATPSEFAIDTGSPGVGDMVNDDRIAIQYTSSSSTCTCSENFIDNFYSYVLNGDTWYYHFYGELTLFTEPVTPEILMEFEANGIWIMGSGTCTCSDESGDDGSGDDGSGDDGSGDDGSGDDNDDDDNDDDETPPTPTPQPIVTEWSISHTDTLTFNPFSTFNYRRTDEVGVSIGSETDYALIGETVDLEFGTVTVNADMTLTYDPFDDLIESGTLEPEVDANGNVFRYSGIERFEAHLFDLSLLDPNAPANPNPALAYASVPIELAVSNNLPALRGDRIPLSRHRRDHDSRQPRLPRPEYHPPSRPQATLLRSRRRLRSRQPPDHRHYLQRPVAQYEQQRAHSPRRRPLPESDPRSHCRYDVGNDRLRPQSRHNHRPIRRRAERAVAHRHTRRCLRHRLP